MFRVSTWVLLGIIAASMFAWVLSGGSLDGPRVAGWTDLGTWGWGTKVADLSKTPEKPVTAKVAVVEKVAPAEKSDKAAKPAEKSDKWDVKDGPAKPAAKPADVAEAPMAKEAAPWDLDSTKGVDIDLNIKLPWQKDKAAEKPAPAPAKTAVVEAVPSMPWPIATEVPNWGAVMKVPAPANDVEWKVEEPKKTAAIPPAPSALPWPIATEVPNWGAIMKVPAPAKSDEIDWNVVDESKGATGKAEVALEGIVTEEAIDWPIADAPVKWANVRMVAEVAVSVTAQAIDWPIADAPVKWTNVRMAAPEPEVSVTAQAIDWPIAEAPVKWTNVRMAEPEPVATEVEAWEKPRQWQPPSEEVRRAELTPEQVACEDELRRIYKSGVIRFKSDSAVIDAKSTATLNELANAAKSCAKARIRVEGHTDAQGANDYNKSLSVRRAQAIVAYLTGAGVDKGSVVAEGFGEERPIASNDDAEGMAQNRRIEFTVY